MSPEDFNLARLKEHFLGKANKRRRLGALVVFAFFFLEATLFPRAFLAVSPGVNSVVLFLAFEISFASVTLLEATEPRMLLSNS